MIEAVSPIVARDLLSTRAFLKVGRCLIETPPHPQSEIQFSTLHVSVQEGTPPFKVDTRNAATHF